MKSQKDLNPQEEAVISILLEHIEASTETIEDSEELIDRSRKSIKDDVKQINEYRKIINERKGITSSSPSENKKETITKAIFNFKTEDGKEWIKEEFYLGEISNLGLFEKRAYTWLENAEIETGKPAYHKDKVFSMNRRRLGFEKGILYIMHDVIE